MQCVKNRKAGCKTHSITINISLFSLLFLYNIHSFYNLCWFSYLYIDIYINVYHGGKGTWQEQLQQATHALLGDQVKIDTVKIYWLGKRAEPASEHDQTEPRPKLMFVKLTKKEDVQMLMQRQWKLSEVGFPIIYLTQDLTQDSGRKGKTKEAKGRASSKRKRELQDLSR